MTADAHQVLIESPAGSPAEGGALEWIRALVTPVDGFLDAEVRVDGHAVSRAVRRLPDSHAVSAWCDTRGLAPALHEVTVSASWGDGGRASAARLVLVTLGQPATPSIPPLGDAPEIGVVRIGDPALEERLARTSLGGPPLVLLDDDCVLAPGALARIASVFAEADERDVVIGDEASMISEDRWMRWRKRSFQSEALPSIDGVGPLMAVGPRAADILCDALPARSVYELALELVDRDLATTALPQALVLTPAARVPVDGPEERDAVERLAARRGRAVRIADGPVTGLRDVRWPLADTPRVAVVIPSRTPALVTTCLAGLRDRTDYPEPRVVVVDSSPDPGAMDAAVEAASVEASRVHYPDGERFNYQRAANLGAAAAEASHVLFLNDDVVPLAADWLTRMVELLTLPGVGIVGAMLLHPDGTIQHAGVQLDEVSGHRYHDAPGDARGHRFELLVPGNPEAVTGACMLVRREVLDELGGHDEAFVHVYGDVDLCFRARERGWRVAWCPGAVLEHAESASFGHSTAADHDDIELFKSRWQRHRDISPSTRGRS